MKMSDESVNEDTSCSGESTADNHHIDWGLCGKDAEKDSTCLTSDTLSESNCNIHSTGVDHLNSSYPDSPTHPTYYSFESMQAAYQSSYSVNSANTTAFPLDYYSQTSPYGGVISQSYNGSRSMSSKPSSSALTAQAAYLNSSSPFSSSQTTQNPYYYGQYPTSFSNPSANSQSLSTCQQSGFDYTYPNFNHSSVYSAYGYPNYGYITNPSNVNNSSPAPSSMTLSSTTNSSPTTATYQLTQLSQPDTLSHYPHTEDSPSPLKTDNHQNCSNPGPKKGPKSGRGRGKRQPNPSPDPENNLERVFIWNLDETIILYLSVLGNNSNRYGAEDEEYNTVNSVKPLAEQLEQILNHFAENHFFYNDLEEVDQNHVDDTASDDNGQDLSNYNFQNDGFHTNSSCGGGMGQMPPVKGGVDWLRKMAFRYRRIKEIYTQYRDNVGGLLSTQDRENLYRIQRKWDVITNNWTLNALKGLELINSRPRNVNVLVTSLPLVPTLAKVMIFGLGHCFNIENIYSAAKTGKETIFDRVQTRFGKKTTYVVIGKGVIEQTAAEKYNMPYWPVTHLSDLAAFNHALALGHL